MKAHYKVLILGAGSGGLSVAARLAKKLSPKEIAIVDPAKKHYYQPLWTLSGAGVLPKQESERNQVDFIPQGVDWIQESVTRFNPQENEIETDSARKITYDFMVVALGLRLAWEKIPGATEALGKNGVCTIYEYDQVDKTEQMLKSFSGGTALFTMPPVPIKCAGAPQKIMYLADEIFRNTGVRNKTKIFFATAGKAIFGIPVFAEALTKVVQRKNIELLTQHQLISIDGANKKATFRVTDSAGNTSDQELNYDLIHVVPPMVAPKVVLESALVEKEGDQKGWLSVDKFTLQHKLFPNVFGVGDVTGVPNSKTGAAIRKQAPIVVDNLLNVMNQQPPQAKYDGYSSCPLVTEVGKVILAEFGYDGKLLPSFPVNPAKERRSMWILKRYLLPKLYWHGMLRGRA
ncbi:MAG: NAD(P)/FAD-dependent oxidoreductase [Proteobacteria bacterium]|nr:NAD(P)/FAD-dependent oxidoreductase [Pseudomonadota bacterium]